MKSTKAPTSESFLKQLLFNLFLLFVAGAMFFIAARSTINEVSYTHDFFSKDMRALLAFGGLFILFSGFIIGKIAGLIHSRIHLYKEQKIIQQTNPYAYYRELPNNYSIGIASLLCDSAIENEKDIIAAILDLCAQGYLRLSKHSDHYVIRLQPSKQNSPLSNEQYILDLIRQGHLSHIDYQKWYGHCVEDGVQLGLFKPPENDLFNYSRQYIIQFNRKHKRKADLLFLILFIIIIGALIAKDFNPSGTLSSIVPWIVIGGLAVITIRLLIKLVIAAGKLSKEASRRTFKAELTNRLTKTPQGTAELQKLLAFRNFLAQFRTFVDKDPEAVILWDRYLSYAQVFGLSKEIMRSGYRQLIDNAAFKIDDIDNISLQNISS